MTYKRWRTLHDELWKLKLKTYDVKDDTAGNVLSRLCSMMQEILSYIPKEDRHD